MAEIFEEPFAIRRSHPGDVARVIDIWRGAVAATHDFLREADRAEIDSSACAYLATAELWVLVDAADRPMAFSAVTGSNMDALFVAAEAHGKGMGRRLVQHARSLSPTSTLTTQVNEGNAQALGFYLKQGFKPTRRDECDDDGRPYPIIQLAWHGDGCGGGQSQA
jgi:putative acetyltransferase